MPFWRGSELDPERAAVSSINCGSSSITFSVIDHETSSPILRGALSASASLFLNSSFGIGPEFSQSGLEGPSIFPNTSVGARFAIKPIEEIVLRTAASTECRWIDRTEREHYSRRVTA
jgi:hypothetical protein